MPTSSTEKSVKDWLKNILLEMKKENINDVSKYIYDSLTQFGFDWGRQLSFFEEAEEDY